MRLNSGHILQEQLQKKYIQDSEKIANYMLYIIMGSLIINTLGTIAKIIMIVVALPLIALIWISGSADEDIHSEKAAEAFIGMLLAFGMAIVTGLNIHYGWLCDTPWPHVDCGATLCAYMLPVMFLVLACMACTSMIKELRY